MRDSTPGWQKILAQGFSSSAELLEFLHLPASLGSSLAEKEFKTRVPQRFAGLMERGNPRDPLLLQVLAAPDELIVRDDFVADPLEERSTNPVAGLIHKYHGRVLLTFGVCAIHCRYCFRRHFPYQQNNPAKDHWQAARAYIESDDSLQEVILSGGDPLLAKDNALAELLQHLTNIPHLRTLRVHTRVPVVLPERINESLLQLLTELPLQKVIVLHTNHPREFDEQAARACADLRKAGCHVFNQSVLLAGINNNPYTLKELSERAFECGVIPYYLHVLDRVKGAGHFDVSYEEAKHLFRKLQSLLPGYLVPRLVREEPGMKNKTLL